MISNVPWQRSGHWERICRGSLSQPSLQSCPSSRAPQPSATACLCWAAGTWRWRRPRSTARLAWARSETKCVVRGGGRRGRGRRTTLRSLSDWRASDCGPSRSEAWGRSGQTSGRVWWAGLLWRSWRRSGRRRARGRGGRRWGRGGGSGPVERMLETFRWLWGRRVTSRGSQVSGDLRAGWRTRYWSGRETLGRARPGRPLGSGAAAPGSEWRSGGEARGPRTRSWEWWRWWRAGEGGHSLPGGTGAPGGWGWARRTCTRTPAWPRVRHRHVVWN